MVSRNVGFRFSLVSYNILSQSLLNDHNYLYTSCNPKDLEWPRRGHRILSELIQKKADIICLQEVESEHLQSLYRPKLASHGYHCLYKKKTGFKIDGCAIFYKSKIFRLLDHKGVEFKRTDVTSILTRDNVGIIAILRPHLVSDSEIVIANTHLIFNPVRSDVKLAQLRLFLSELEELSSIKGEGNEKTHSPTILCGDFNSLPDSVVHKYVVKSQSNLPRTNHGPESNQQTTISDNELHQEESQAKEVNKDNHNDNGHTFQFKSVYPNKNEDGEPYVSTFSSCIVDYIFYTPKLRLESYRRLLTEEELREVGPIPNSHFPSDHLTLEAMFVLK